MLAVAGGLALLLDERPFPAPQDAPAIERRLRERFDAQHLNYRYVVCVPNGRRFGGRAVVRCNVNFNAPHIEVYCAVLHDERLLTNHEDPAVPCPRDDAGEDPPVQESP